VIFPNLWVALRFLLTLPVTVASGEWSFFKLKLIKIYLRSTMVNERLVSISILSIENEIYRVFYSHKEFFPEKIKKSVAKL